MKSVKTSRIQIFLAGDLATIKQVCREQCHEIGLCVTVEPTTFIYTGGEESGAVIGLLNYPRFPTTPKALLKTAHRLALLLRDRACQRSVLIVAPDQTFWLTNGIVPKLRQFQIQQLTQGKLRATRA